MAAARTRSRFDREDARPKSDVYTGLLAISLIAMIVSCILLYLDYAQYGGKAPPVTAAPQSQPKNISQGSLPPPPPIEERPFTMAPAPIAPTFVQQPEPSPVIPAAAIEPPTPIVIPAAIEIPAPAPTTESPACPTCPGGACPNCPTTPAPSPPPPTIEAPAATPPATSKPGDPPPLPKSVREKPPQ